MSQYSPPPYQPPPGPGQLGYSYPYPQGPGGAGGPAARRAGVMLFVIGGLSLAGGLCCGVTGSMVPQMLAQQPEVAQQLPPEATPELIRLGMLIAAGMGLVYGVVLVVLGLFVRKGSKGAVVTALVLTGLALLYLCYNTIRTAVVGAQQGVEAASGGICTMLVPLVLYVLLMVWLIQALRETGRQPQGYPPEYWAYWQQQYAQQQAWQQQQQQGGGQASQPPAPPPPPPPPPASGSGD